MGEYHHMLLTIQHRRGYTLEFLNFNIDIILSPFSMGDQTFRQQLVQSALHGMAFSLYLSLVQPINVNIRELIRIHSFQTQTERSEMGYFWFVNSPAFWIGFFIQGVPYHWAHFVFVIFSGPRAHTEELFIAIG